MAGIDERIEKSKNWFERLADHVPGYKGYKQKELKREADKIERLYVAERLGVLNDLLTPAYGAEAIRGSSASGAEEELFDVCAQHGISYVAYAPLGRGFLSGAIRTIDDLTPDDFGQIEVLQAP